MLPYKLILVNPKTETELHVASFLLKPDAVVFGDYVVAQAAWSLPRMWYSYRIETEE